MKCPRCGCIRIDVKLDKIGICKDCGCIDFINLFTETTMQMKQANYNLFIKICEERIRQDKKFSPQSYNPEVWLSIMSEEVGEMAQAINETMFDNGPEKRKLGGIENIQKELVQILAVGFAMYADLDNKIKEVK